MSDLINNHMKDFGEDRINETPLIADLFLQVSRELAQSDARTYRTVGRHFARTREILRQAEDSKELSLLPETTVNDLFVGEPSYERQTRKSLENLCRLNGVRGYSRMSKKAMISVLKDKGVPDPPTPLAAFAKNELIDLLEEAMRRLHKR